MEQTTELRLQLDCKVLGIEVWIVFVVDQITEMVNVFWDKDSDDAVTEVIKYGVSDGDNWKKC